MKPKILYEDEYVLALDKPSGLLVHPAAGQVRYGTGSDGRTLVDWIMENRPELEEIGEEQILQNGEKIKRPGIVHRLDRETSGVILVCKTTESFSYIKSQFQNRKVEKVYRAFVWGKFMEGSKEGKIEKLIGRSASDFRRWSAEYGAKGDLREAVTEYKVLKQDERYAYLEVKPKTGRTHQIRVHMKAVSHPVVCDKLYAPKLPPALGLERLALHAYSIRLELPNGKELYVESPLPPEFKLAEEAIIC